MKDLENFLIDENAPLKDALVKIKNNKSRHVFVTLKETQKIIGVISEGDIIHSFLKGYDLHSRASDIYNANFIYLDESDKDNKEKIISIFKEGILIIPILDFNLNIIDVINYIEFID
ncbi:CBS domain-containing protein [Gammaproteobacteria bacterium]|jgi:signal-transduction protein with cAMP-binding, CBS, and nucleotidyltransferase domain|nr:CBS domain-containing protein [Gammaproteobacteria bacterium]|tara:strand:+ start:89 stop:439 length:351 start_codon:yes stop_codon:yes gene_type:complete